MHKKILFITYDGMTDPLGQSQVIPYLQILSGEGYKITILSVEKRDRFEKGKDNIERILSESGISWEKLMFSTKPPILSKLYDQWRLNQKAEQLFLKEKFDFVHCRSYVPAASAIKLQKKFGVPYLFDMRGFWVDERVDNGQWNLKNPFYKLLYQVYKQKEKKYLKHAKHIITLTHKGRNELLTSFGISESNVSVIPCCADLGHFDYNKISDAQREELKESLKIDSSTKVLTYLGSLGGWYLVEEMLDFFKVLRTKNSNTIFLFITHDLEESVLRHALGKGIPDNCIKVVAAARNQVPLLLSISDWSVFFIKNAYSKKASSPTKQGEIMAMGIPVVCNDIGDTGLIVTEAKSGKVVSSFELKEYEEAADYLLSNTYNKSDIRKSSFQYFNLENAGDEYCKVYRKFE